MEKHEKKEIFLLGGIFLFFCIVLLFVPITGDDWYNYTIGKKGALASVQNAIVMYFTWEGRFISRLLINFFTCHRFFYILCTSFLVTSLCYFIANFIKTKQKYLIYFITIIFLLTLENTMWTQSFLWVAGSITYLFPCVLLIGYFYFYFHYTVKKEHLSWKHYLFSLFFSFFITMFVENVAVCYITFHFVVLLYSFSKNKRIDFYLLFNSILAVSGFLFMLFSPGSAARMLVDENHFQNLSLLSKIKLNVPNFLHYTFLSNLSLMVLLFLIFVICIRQFYRTKWKYVFYILAFFLFFFFFSIVLLHQLNISNKGWDFLFLHLYSLVFIVGFIGVCFLLLLFRFLSIDRIVVLFLSLFVGFSNNLAMLISPVWGGRVSLVTTVILFVVLLYFLLFLLENSSIKVSSSVFLILLSFALLLMISTIVTYYGVFRFTFYRERKIKTQLLEKREYITVYTMPRQLLWGNDPLDEFHIKYFKKYYHIPDNVKLIYQDFVLH